MKQVTSEYHLKYYLSENDVLRGRKTMEVSANFRKLDGTRAWTGYHICRLNVYADDYTILSKLPIKYVYSSGMTSLEGFKNHKK